MWTISDSTPRTYTYFQFGIQRSGTTIIDQLIKKYWNYWKANDCDQYKPVPFEPQPQKECVWKHNIDIPKNFEKGLPAVIVYKNPYTWAESMAFRNGMGNGGWNATWGHENLDLYKQPRPGWNNVTFPGMGTCNFGQISYVYKHWCETWLPYAEEYADTTVLIRYEDLLRQDSRNAIFKEIADKFGWDPIEEDIELIPHVGSSQPMDENRMNYYLNMAPKHPMFFQHGPRYKQSINDILGAELFERLGYKIL